jgi:hypothetical protein
LGIFELDLIIEIVIFIEAENGRVFLIVKLAEHIDLYGPSMNFDGQIIRLEYIGEMPFVVLSFQQNIAGGGAGQMEGDGVGGLGDGEIPLHGFAGLYLYADVAVFAELPIVLSNREGIRIGPCVT